MSIQWGKKKKKKEISTNSPSLKNSLKGIPKKGIPEESSEDQRNW